MVTRSCSRRRQRHSGVANGVLCVVSLACRLPPPFFNSPVEFNAFYEQAAKHNKKDGAATCTTAQMRLLESASVTVRTSGGHD
jgi:hypothetical protein